MNGLMELPMVRYSPCLVEEYSRPGVVVIFTDDSVRRGVKYDWGYSARLEGRDPLLACAWKLEPLHRHFSG